jgi:pcfD
MALTKEAAKNLSIISVAEQLGMELKRTGAYSYMWTEHDSFVIDARKNDFHWNSRSEFGDVIQLVQTIQGVTYKEAMHFLETGEFKKVDLTAQIGPKEPFRYSLERYEHPDFKASRSYLRDQRGLSDDTIDFFLSQGSMTEATRKKGDYFEPVIVFKYKDNTGFLAGASLQGVVENRVHYPERGRLKQIMRNSDGQLGFSVDIGKPKRLVFAEAPIDLMSYYELHKDNLQDVRLVAMDGVKEGIISRRFMELYAEMNGKAYQVDQNTGKALETVVNTTDYFKDGQHQNMITLAVDNDAAGHNFITRLQEKGIPFQITIPPILQPDQEKEDWNDFLKRGNESPNELVHVYSADEESWHYQGYFSKEIALAKAQELTADDVKAFVSARQLTKEEVHQEYTRIINQEKERKHTMSEVHESGAEYETEKPDNSRLAQAKRKLERLKGEADEAINAAYSHQSLTNGQPMNDKRGGGRFMQKQEQIENRVFSKLDEIKEQEERIERLKEREDRKAAGLNRQGNGLDMSVQNIPRIREEIEKAERGESSYRPETIKRYKKELERLEGIQDKVDGLVIQPETQALIDAGEVKQWAKQPNIYFVKGLRRVALELTEEGRFELSPKYRPNTDEEKEMVNKLLSNQKKREDETQKSALTPDTSNLSPEDAEWLKQNWNNISFSVEPKKRMVIDSDKTVTFEKPSNPLGDSSRALEENQSTKEEISMAEPFTDVQKEHIREFFKTRISDVQTDYIFLNSGQEDLGYFLDGYLFANHYAELYPLSPEKQVDILMSRLISDDGREFDEIELGFTINRIDKDFLRNKFGYNPDTPIEEYRQSEKNIDRIQAKEEEAFLQSIDREDFNKVLELVKENDVWTVFQLQTDEELGVNTSQVYDFIERYLDPNHDLDYGFDNQFFSNLRTEDLLKKAEEKGLYLNQEKTSTINQLREKEEAVLPAIEQESKQEIIEYKLKPRWESADEITANSFEELKMKFLEQMDRRIELEKKFTASNLEFQKDRHSIAMGVWPDKRILKYMRDDSFDFEVNGFRIESSWNDNPYDLLDSISEDGKIFYEMTYHEIQKEMEEYQRVQNEEIHHHNRKDEMDRDLDGDGISNSDEMLQGTDPYNAASNLHKKQEERERKTDAEVAAGATITEAIATKNSEQTISQLVANKDTKALAEHLKEGMKNYLDSDQFKSFLDTMSKFHNYSLNNIHLLKMQNPNVTQVASFNKWKTDFERTVKKGSKALKIWVPYQVKTKIPDKQKELTFGQPEKEMDQKEITVTRFKLGNVFDVSQTEGKELPKAIHELTGSVKDYEDLYRAAKAVSMDNQVPISFEEIKRENTRGYYSPSENRIVISKKLKGEEHILKTIFHEMAHADLHKETNAQYGDDQYRKQELQAESVAYVVASHFGFDTSSYSFGYLAIWSKDKNGFEDMVEQLQVVQKEAKSLIDRMDAKLELVKNKTVVKDKFADKLQQAKEKSEKLSSQKAEAVKQVEEKSP